MIESLSGKTGVGDGGSRGQDWVTAIISRKIEKKMEKKKNQGENHDPHKHINHC